MPLTSFAAIEAPVPVPVQQRTTTGATMVAVLVLAASATDGAAGQALQILGALLVLSGFVAAQRGLLDVNSRVYLTINLLGSALLTTLAAIGGQYGFMLLNGAWALISLISLVRGPR